jgi:hypothetical protein
VNGECATDYQIKTRHDSGRVKTVFKKKDLSLCKDRSETNLGIPVTHYPTEKVCDVLYSSFTYDVISFHHSLSSMLVDASVAVTALRFYSYFYFS